MTAYFFFQLNTGLDVPVVPAALISVLIFAPLLGLALDRILLRRLATAPVYARIVGSIGLLIALPSLALWLVEALGNTVLDFGLPTTSGTGNATVRGIGPFPREVWHLDWLSNHVSLNSDQVAVFVAALLAAIALWIVLRHTRLGLEMRAVVNRSDLADLRGVNASRTSSAAWILTMMLAGIGGILIAPLFQLADQQFTLIVLGSLAAVALAGLRSIPVAFVGGLLLGVLQNLVYGYGDTILPKFLNELAGLRSAIPFILTVVLLFVVGRNKGAEARSVSEERPMEDHRDGLPPWRRILPWVVFLFLFVAFTLQWFPWGWAQASDFEALGILAPGMALAIVFLSFVVVTGLGGMVSLAQGTFVTAGGFVAGWAVNHDFGVDIPFVASHGKINFAAAAVMGALAGAALGALIAVPVRRLGVLALALASLAIALALDLTLFQMQDVSNGQLGWLYPLPTLDVFGITTFDLSHPRTDGDGAPGHLRGDDARHLQPAEVELGARRAGSAQLVGGRPHVGHRAGKKRDRSVRARRRDRRLRRRDARHDQRDVHQHERHADHRAPVVGRGRDLRDPATGRRAARRPGGDGDHAGLPVDLGLELHARLVQRPQQLHLLRVDHVRPRCDQPGEEPRRAVRTDGQPAPRTPSPQGARGAGRAGRDRCARGRDAPVNGSDPADAT